MSSNEPTSQTDSEADEELNDEIEELSFGDNVTIPKNKRRKTVLFTFLTILITLAVLAVGGGLWWMWQYHWRTLTISVDGANYSARAGTTVADFLRAHNTFDRAPGRLLSVNNKVLEKTGGNPATVNIDGSAVPHEQWADTRLDRDATMTVTPGTDRIEEHTVEKASVPFPTDINLNNGPIQIVTQQGEDGVQEVWHGKKSGETAKKTMLKKAKALVVKSYSPRPDGKKVIALTFDDGPSQYTGKILDILKKNSVKATFFELGEQSLEMPDADARIVKEGHQLASHSVSHPYLPKMSRDAMREEITTSFADIKKARGTETRTFRAPYGAFGVEQWKEAADLIDKNVLWDIDTTDWAQPGVKEIRKQVVGNAHNGAIALMHSGGGDRSETVKALPDIIKDLKKAGYSFVTVDELCDMAGLPAAAQPN